MTPLLLCCAVSLAGIVIVLGLCALYLRRISQEARAIRLVLQARWDYDRVSRVSELCEDRDRYWTTITPQEFRELELQALLSPRNLSVKKTRTPWPRPKEEQDSCDVPPEGSQP
mgnify:CR=1 FL=1